MGRKGGDKNSEEKENGKLRRRQNNWIWNKQYGPDTNLWHTILKSFFGLCNHCDPSETIGFKLT